MKTQYEVIDNFLSPDDFINIKNTMFSNNFPWVYEPNVLNYPNKETSDELYFFTHTFYRDYVPQSNFISILDLIIKKLNPKSIVRIQANLYPNVNKYIESKFHRDYDYSHKGAVFYLNTNNGFTELEDGTKIQSIENRILLHDPFEFHKIVPCTDEKVRIVIVFNYF
jgi:hypothetical protein